MRFNKDFYNLFLIKEGKELAGKRAKNIFGLFAILLATFLSIGFGRGGLDYLKIKMDDPFQNWLTVPIPYNSNIAKSFNEILDNDSIKNHYKFKKIIPYSIFFKYFFNVNGDLVLAEGRTIETSSNLLKKILSDEFLVEGVGYDSISNYLGDHNVGLIVCKDYLEKLGYSHGCPPFLNMVYELENNTNLKVPIPVVSVVKQLPGMVSIMTTPLFFQEIYVNQNYACNISDTVHQKYLRYFIPDSENATRWNEKISSLLNSKWPGIVKVSFLHEYKSSLKNGKYLHIDLNQIYINDKIRADSLDQYLNSLIDFSKNHLIRIYDYNFQSLRKTEINQDYFSVYFNQLDSISQFAQYLLNKAQLKVELSQIEAKKNFDFVSKLTLIISFFLIIFSIISVSMFLNNLIKSHFERIKKNIGTFKAFGLDNKALIITYSVISFSFVTFASAIAFGLAYFLGSVGTIKILLSSMGLNLEKGHNYFNLITKESLLTFLIIIALSTFTVILHLIKMLKQTPGDLIYERQ
jgi:hypothetical protein